MIAKGENMPAFGDKSKGNLRQAHPDLQLLFEKVVEKYDCSVICGHRDEMTQNDLFEQGMSKLQWPDSKHNKMPSLAVDVVPYPVDWKDKARFYHFAGYVFGVARSMGIKLRWGGDWDGDLSFSDQNFHDLPHFELVNE